MPDQMNQPPVPTFLDALQKQVTQQSQLSPGVGQTSGATQRATQILQAKSGKLAPQAGVAQSNIGEQVAGQVAGQQLQGQIAPEMQIQQAGVNQQATAQAQQTQTQQAGITQQNKFNTANYKIQLADINQQLNQGMGQLSTEKKQAMLNQAAFLMNMQNTQYVAKLQQVGQMRNLQSKSAMQDQIQNLVFGSNVDNLKTMLGQDNILQVGNRTFQQASANMSYQDAQKIAATEMKYRQQMGQLQAQQLQYGADLQSNLSSIGGIGQGISGVIGGAGQAYQANQNSQDRAQAAQDRQSLARQLKYNQDKNDSSINPLADN